MVLEIRLVEDERTLLSLPLPEKELTLGAFELDDAVIRRLSDLYSIGSNQKRLRVMAELAKGGELRFSDVMQMVTNPKLAQDCLQPMLRQGLVVHGGRGTGYRFSPKALPLMATMTVGLARMLAVVEKELEGRGDE